MLHAPCSMLHSSSVRRGTTTRTGAALRSRACRPPDASSAPTRTGTAPSRRIGEGQPCTSTGAESPNELFCGEHRHEVSCARREFHIEGDERNAEFLRGTDNDRVHPTKPACARETKESNHAHRVEIEHAERPHGEETIADRRCESATTSATPNRCDHLNGNRRG